MFQELGIADCKKSKNKVGIFIHNKHTMKKGMYGVCILNCFMWSSLPCFFTFCHSAVSTFCSLQYNLRHLICWRLVKSNKFLHWWFYCTRFTSEMEPKRIWVEFVFQGARQQPSTHSMKLCK